MKIYTKTGDDGTTALFDGSRVSKDNRRVELYGNVDELNGMIGLAISFATNAEFKNKLFKVQKDLFALGAKLANPKERQQKQKADFDEQKVTWLENEIDSMETALTPMTTFILPGGHSASAALHVARTICRRVERHLVSFTKTETLDPLFVKFVNRLSDYLFVAARFANHLEGKKDIPWT